MLNRPRTAVLLLSLFVCTPLFFHSRPVSAHDDWLPIDPAELKMTTEPLAPGAPAIILNLQVDRNDAGEASVEHDYVRIKILTDEGRKYANVEIPFDKTSFRISDVRARTIRPDGSLVNFDGKIYENTVVRSKSLKYLAKTFSMPEVTVGSIIEYRYKYYFTDGKLFDSHWILSQELFTKHAQLSLKPFTGEGWYVKSICPVGYPKDSDGVKQGSDGVFRMTAANIPAFQIEDYMPPENELKMRVDFIYQKYQKSILEYQKSILEPNVNTFWNEFAKEESDRIESFLAKQRVGEQVVAQIVASGDSPAVKLQKIYARTQRVRNLSYEAEKTEQEEKREKIKRAANVQDLLKKGYGWGDEITWLFLGLARAAGFEAYPCLVSSRSEYFFQRQRMNSAELNAKVVLVKVNGQELYFEPGAAFTPYGLLPWPESGVVGLKLTKDGGTWIQTTLPESESSHIERNAELKLLDDGSLEGQLTVTYTGLEALSRRVEERNEDDTERKKYLEEQIKDAIPAGCEVELTNKPNWETSELSLAAEFHLKVPGWVSAVGRRALLPTGLFAAHEKTMFEHADRIYPVYFIYPYKKIDDLKIELPLGWKTINLPKPFDQDVKGAQFTLKVDDNNGSLHIRRELRSDLFLLSKESYPALRHFYQTVKTQDEQQIMLQPDGAAAAN